jgi:membrane protein YdbS with pleckstrin-like domain
MAKRENPNQVPKKFRKLKKSFLLHLQEDNNSFFQSFPTGLTFYGKEKDENVVLIVRSHWIIYLPYAVISFVILGIPILMQLIVSDLSRSTAFFIGVFLACLTISITVIIYAFVRWFYNVNIITDKRVIDLDFTSVVSHTLSEARLDKVEDVTHKQVGALGSLFDIGTVYIQTAGATAEIEFDNIPRPRDVQDILYDLLESKQKGEI